jgi:hypothetical protein
LPKDCLKRYGVLIKYPFLAAASGIGFAVDYAFSAAKILPLSIDPQLGPIFLSAMAGAAFDDVKRRVILGKKDAEIDLEQGIEREEKKAPEVKEKKKKETSTALNATLTAVSVAAAGISASIAPQSVITPYLAGIAGGTIKASLRDLNDVNENYGFLIKYPLLGIAAGAGFAIDHALSNRLIFPISFNPQLGMIASTAIVGAAFNDMKNRVILKKKDDDDDDF